MLKDYPANWYIDKLQMAIYSIVRDNGNEEKVMTKAREDLKSDIKKSMVIRLLKKSKFSLRVFKYCKN